MQSRSGREGGSLRVSGEPQVGGLQGHRRIDEHFAHAGQDVFNGFKVQADVRDSRLVGVRSLLRAEALADDRQLERARVADLPREALRRPEST